MLTENVWETAAHYWASQLAELPPSGIPPDRPILTEATPDRPRELSRLLSPDLVERLAEITRANEVTLFTTFVAALAALLHRYTGRTDIVLGSQVLCRNRAEMDATVGPFMNALVLRADVSGNPSFTQLLTRVGSTVSKALDYDFFPLEKAVEGLRIQKEPADLNRVVNINFVYQHGLVRQEDSPPIVDEAHSAPQRDVNISVSQRAGRWKVLFEYDSRLFEEETIAQLLGCFFTLLDGIGLDPNRKISEYRLLTPAQEALLIRHGNSTLRSYPKDLCLHQVFEQQVDRTPDAVAVSFEDQRLTYRELNVRANQLAAYLRNLGVGPETLVALRTERSLDTVVGLIGILKSGGAYLPIDTAYPKDRVSFMLEDAQVRVLLTQEPLLASLVETSARVVCLDTEWATIAREGTGTPSNDAGPDSLAYVIYTSGSTGKPKGCLVTHQNVVRLMRATHEWFQFHEGDVWTLFHSHAFDFSVWEIWGALLYGGRLVVVPYWVTRSPDLFHNLLCDQRVTVLNQTPSAFRELIHADERAGDSEMALRLVIFGGEALKLESLRPWFEKHGDERPQLVNMYGITETTVHVTYRPISFHDVREGRGSVIGGPIPDLVLYILDSQLQPVPVGVPGEICVGGAGVARGYLNRPELTRERFIDDPFCSEPGARLYRSGDLARRLANGDVEYLGRIDQQVKIRGFRIELGEIEAATAQHPGVKECVVIAREDRGGDKRLVAYIVASPDARPEAGTLREFLTKRLPEYMVPSAFVTLDRIPLTENGKLDRRALPDPSRIPVLVAPDASRRNAARDDVETVLTAIWESVLDQRPIGRTDNFFEIGGHSLVAARLFATMEKVLGKALPLATLFQAPTIEKLSAVLRKDGWTPPWGCLVPIRPSGTRAPFFFVHAIGGNVLNFAGFTAHFGDDQPVYGLQAKGLDGKEPPTFTVEQMAADYIREIRSVQRQGPYYIGGFSAGAIVAFEMARQLQAAGEQVPVLALLEGEMECARTIGTARLWWRTARFNVRYALHIGPRRFFARKFRNWKMQARIHFLPWKNNPSLLNTEEAFMVALKNYVAQPYSGSAILFTTEDELGRYSDLTLGWGPFIRGGLECRTISGDHETLLFEPHIGRLAAVIRDCLDRAEGCERLQAACGD